MHCRELFDFTGRRFCFFRVLALFPVALLAADFRAVDPPQLSNGAIGAIMSARQGIRAPILTGRDEVPEAIVDPLRLTNIFEGPWFNDDPELNDGFLNIPPDPIGAAGPEHVIAVINSLIEARRKDGTLAWIEGLEKFLRVADTPLEDGIFPFDPKILYDSHRNRFVVVGLELDLEKQISRIILAVSKTATPAGPGAAHWYVHRINAKTFVSGPGNCWVDYPGFEVDEEAVYVTANLFNFDLTENCGVRLWILRKTGFYTGAAATVKKLNPYANVGIPITTMPTAIRAANGAGPGVGTFLVSYSGLTDGRNEAVQVVRVNNPLGSTTFTHRFVLVGDIEDFVNGEMPDAPQKGSSVLIEANDRRALDSVWWNNELWFVTQIDPRVGPDKGQATAHWFKVGTASTNFTLLDQGNVGGEDIGPKTTTTFPAIAINDEGHVKIGFSAFNKNIFASAYAAGRLHNDPSGTVRASEVLKRGLAPYVRTFGGSRNRWGDYSGISIDPSDNNSMWVFNEFADTRGTVTEDPHEDGRWGTVWGKGTFK